MRTLSLFETHRVAGAGKHGRPAYFWDKAIGRYPADHPLANGDAKRLSLPRPVQRRLAGS